MATIEAEIPFTKEEIAVLACVLSSIDLLDLQDLELTEDEKQVFDKARSKITQLAR